MGVFCPFPAFATLAGGSWTFGGVCGGVFGGVSGSDICSSADFGVAESGSSGLGADSGFSSGIGSDANS